MNQSRGFTLVEVLVALTLGAMVLLLGSELFRVITESASHLHASAARMDADRGGERWLREAFGTLEVGRPGDVAFDGDSAAVRFSARPWTASGWPARRTVEIGMNGNTLTLRTETASPIPVRQGARAVGFDYLLSLGADSRWVSSWHSPVSAPVAVRMRIAGDAGTDTLLLFIGARG